MQTPFVIIPQNNPLCRYEIRAESPEKALEILRGYGQYKVNASTPHSLFEAKFEVYDDMIREDLNLLETF